MKKAIISLTAALACFTPWADAQILVGPDGAGPFAFDLAGPAPSAANGWTTGAFGSGAGTYTTPDALDAAVIAGTDATTVTVGVDTLLTGTLPPSQSASGFRWNTNDTGGGYFLQSRPTSVAYVGMLATLQNDSGAVLSSIFISYDWNQLNPNPVNENVPGHRAFWSLTGLPGSWTLIPEFSTFTTTSTAQNLSAIIPLGSWDSGDRLYLFWADDNGPGSTTNPMEGAYTIDNFTVLTSVTTGVRITNPQDGASFVEGVSVPITVAASPDVTSVDFLVDGNVVGNDPTPPFAISVPGLALGSHVLTAVGATVGGPVTSDPVDITVNPNQPPTVVITTPTNHPYHLVGWALTNLVVVADPDGTISSVVWSIDGAPKFTNTGSVFIYESSLAGDHTLGVEVTDNIGATATATADFTIYNPPTPPYSLLVTNGSLWKYYNTSNEPPADGGGLAWNQPGYDDELWLSGIGQLGNGDDAEGRPKRTPIDIGPAGARYITIYFRREFTVADPGLYTNLVLRLEIDDGAVVYINGLEVAAYNMPPGPYTYATLATVAEVNDGRYFVNLNIDLVNGAQGNPLEEINSLAVEVHQVNATSSDFTFDLMLWGEEPHVTDGPNIATDGDGNVVITWNNYVYDGYSLQSTETLESDPNATVWTTIPTAVPGLAIVPATLPHQFFRLFRP